jgi:ubiquinone/menaquinone biosynthesis C-methylase UbiE
VTDRAVDREYLTKVQYASADNLAARQSIYRYQQPQLNAPSWALDLARMRGDERVLDVGCGNGTYLWLLGQRHHAGPVFGFDLSPGMLPVGRDHEAMLGVCDAQQLPFPDATMDALLAMHMLYHVPDRSRGLTEMRRVLRPGGVMLVVTNSSHHLHQLNAIVHGSLRDVAGIEGAGSRAYLKFKCETGEHELREHFDSVEHHEARSELVVPEVEPVVDYVRSMSTVIAAHEHILTDVERRVREVIDRDGAFRVDTHMCCFVCR